MRIAVTGAEGRLGFQLVKMGCIPMKCDITKLEDIKSTLSMIQPDVIINCAAKTNVDRCETPEGWKEAIAVNLYGTEKLRNAFSGRLIHLSTDYIFDGKNGAYSENYKDKDPVNAYGQSKYGGEVALLHPLDETKPTCIVRTTGLYGGFSQKPDVVTLILDRLRSGEELKMTYELIGNQTYVPFLAEALLKLAEMPEWKYPIINIGSDEVISRYDFALAVAGVFNLNKDLLIPCKNSEVANWIAVRPKKAGLKTTLAKKLRLPIYTVLDGIKHYRDDTRGI